MKKRKLLLAVCVVLVGIGVISYQYSPKLSAAVANVTIRVVDHLNNIIGTGGATVGPAPAYTVNIVDSTNHIIDTFGGGITPPAGDIGGTTGSPTIIGLHLPVTAITQAQSPYTVLTTDVMITCDATGGNTTINLPAATGSKRQITITKIDSSAGGCIPTRNGTDTINGATAENLPQQNSVMTLIDRISGTWLATATTFDNSVGTGISGSGAIATRIFCNSVTCVAQPSFQINNDNFTASMARMPLTFPIAAVAATTTTQWGEQKVVKALTIENVVFNVGAFACSVNPSFSLLDCSATAGTCTPVATLATSGTLTGIGSTNAATTPTANVAAGEYMAVEFTAGTCTVLNGSVQAMARPQ